MREQCPRRRPHRTRRCGERQAVRCRGSGLFVVGLSTPAGRLRREVSVSAVYLGLERLVLTGEQVGFPVGQRVEFDPHRGRDVSLHRYSPAWASMYSSMTSLDTSPAVETKYERVHSDGKPKSNSSRRWHEE